MLSPTKENADNTNLSMYEGENEKEVERLDSNDVECREEQNKVDGQEQETEEKYEKKVDEEEDEEKREYGKAEEEREYEEDEEDEKGKKERNQDQEWEEVEEKENEVKEPELKRSPPEFRASKSLDDPIPTIFSYYRYERANNIRRIGKKESK